jgi:hypothetical protein
MINAKQVADTAAVYRLIKSRLPHRILNQLTFAPPRPNPHPGLSHICRGRIFGPSLKHIWPLQESSGVFSLGGIEVQAAQMEEDVVLEPFFVPIAKCFFD